MEAYQDIFKVGMLLAVIFLILYAARQGRPPRE
jgi:hypothetical protein